MKSWIIFGAELEDKCKTVLPRTVTFTASAEPTATPDIWRMARGGRKHRPPSPLTIKLENRFQPLINQHEPNSDWCWYEWTRESYEDFEPTEKGKKATIWNEIKGKRDSSICNCVAVGDAIRDRSGKTIKTHCFLIKWFYKWGASDDCREKC